MKTAAKNLLNSFFSSNDQNYGDKDIRSQHEYQDLEFNTSADTIGSINVKNSKGKSALHKAIDKENLELTKDLIKNGANLDSRDDQGNTPIHVASMKDDSTLLNELITIGVQTGVLNTLGETALHKAVEAGKIANVSLLISNNGSLINTQTYKPKIPNPSAYKKYAQLSSPLHYALNHKSKRNNSTEISSEVFLEMIQILLEAGADINLKDENGVTPFHLLVSHPKINLFDKNFIDQLFEKAEINEMDNSGKSPIVYAAEAGNLETVKLLINARCDLSGKQGELAVKKSLMNNRIDCLQEIIKAGANPDVHVHIGYSMSSSFSSEYDGKDKTGYLKDGDTPLHFAVISGHEELAELCVQKKSEMVNSQNAKGLTPASYAIKILSPEMARILSRSDFSIDEKQQVPGISNSYFARDTRYNTLLMQGATRGFKNVDEVTKFFTDPNFQLSEQQLKKRKDVITKYGPKTQNNVEEIRFGLNGNAINIIEQRRQIDNLPMEGKIVSVSRS